METCRWETRGMRRGRTTPCIPNLRFHVPGNAARQRQSPLPYPFPHLILGTSALLPPPHPISSQNTLSTSSKRRQMHTKTILSENSISGAPASAGNPSMASETCRGYLGVVDRCRGKRAVSWGQDDTPHSKFEIWLSGKCCAPAARCYSHPAMPSLFLFTELMLSTTHTIQCSRHPL